MSFAFRHQTDVDGQIRHIAKQQIKKALRDASSGADYDQTIHGVRRRVKKLRGLLRLVEPRFDEFKKENSALREAANALGQSRDAAVVIETFDTLVGERGGDLSSEAVAAARAFLVERAETVRKQTSAGTVLDEFAERLEVVGKRVEHWDFKGNGEKLVLDGLGLTYQRMRKAYRAAQAGHHAEDLHEWRKQTKSHLYHVTLLQRAAPDLLKPREKLLETLGDLLGDHHNLAVLADALGENGSPVRSEFAQALNAALTEQEEVLATDAFRLGRQLLVEKPKALEARFGAYWKLLER